MLADKLIKIVMPTRMLSSLSWCKQKSRLSEMGGKERRTIDGNKID